MQHVLSAPYWAKVADAARYFVKALLAVPAANDTHAYMRDKAELLRLAQECRLSAPSLSQELRAIACRD